MENLAQFTKIMNPLQGLVSQPSKFYTQATSKMGKLLPYFMDIITRVGQMQLLRRQIAYELNTSCKFDSKFLASSLQTMNSALLADIEQHYADPSKPYPKEENPLMYELTSYLEASGFHNPLRKIYITTPRLPHFPLFTFLMTLWHLNKLAYNKSIGQCLSVNLCTMYWSMLKVIFDHRQKGGTPVSWNKRFSVFSFCLSVHRTIFFYLGMIFWG